MECLSVECARISVRYRGDYGLNRSNSETGISLIQEHSWTRAAAHAASIYIWCRWDEAWFAARTTIANFHGRLCPRSISFCSDHHVAFDYSPMLLPTSMHTGARVEGCGENENAIVDARVRDLIYLDRTLRYNYNVRPWELWSLHWLTPSRTTHSWSNEKILYMWRARMSVYESLVPCILEEKKRSWTRKRIV